jgi:hypothetical protein
MEGSSRTMQSPNDSKILLKELQREQKEYAEGTSGWRVIQGRIDQIVAQNLLQYVNR